jgi:hypothetical protein
MAASRLDPERDGQQTDAVAGVGLLRKMHHDRPSCVVDTQSLTQIRKCVDAVGPKVDGEHRGPTPRLEGSILRRDSVTDDRLRIGDDRLDGSAPRVPPLHRPVQRPEHQHLCDVEIEFRP